MKTKKLIMVLGIISIILVTMHYQYIATILKKEDTDNNQLPVSLLDIDITIEEEITEGNDTNQSSNDFYDFQIDDIPFVDNNVLEILKTEYSKLDFYGVFQKGNLDVYDYYKEKFNQLLKEEIPFIHKRTGELLYLSEFEELKSLFYGENDLDYYTYYFFDVNEDSYPELCVTDNARFTYIFKYLPDTDDIVLWHEMYNGYFRLNGSRKIRYNRLGDQHEFYTLDEDGNIIKAVRFFNFYQTREVYMLFLPKFTNENKELEVTGLTEEMKEQGYFWEYSNLYSFRVTKEQYYELLKDYFEAEKAAEENLKKLAFSYEELFGAL